MRFLARLVRRGDQLGAARGFRDDLHPARVFEKDRQIYGFLDCSAGRHDAVIPQQEHLVLAEASCHRLTERLRDDQIGGIGKHRQFLEEYRPVMPNRLNRNAERGKNHRIRRVGMDDRHDVRARAHDLGMNENLVVALVLAGGLFALDIDGNQVCRRHFLQPHGGGLHQNAAWIVLRPKRNVPHAVIALAFAFKDVAGIDQPFPDFRAVVSVCIGHDVLSLSFIAEYGGTGGLSSRRTSGRPALRSAGR